MNCDKITPSCRRYTGLWVGSIILGATLLASPASAQEDAAAELSVRQTPRAPTIAWSQQSAMFVTLRSATATTPDASFDAISEKSGYVGPQLEVGVDLGEAVLPGLRGYAIYSGGGYPQRARLGGELELTWSRQMLMLAADYGPELWGVFRPSLRLGGGYSLQSLETDIRGVTRHGFAHGLVGFGALNLALYTPRGLLGRMQVGLVAEYGGLLQTGASFEDMEQPEGHSDGDWTHQQASLGELRGSGQFVTAGAELRIDF